MFCLASILSWVIKSRIDLHTWAELKGEAVTSREALVLVAGRLADSALVPSRGFFPQCWSSFPHRRLIAKVWVRNNEVTRIGALAREQIGRQDFKNILMATKKFRGNEE